MANETKTNSNADYPAYPSVLPEGWREANYGLSKREYFAGLAMQGLLANGSTLFTKMEPETVALHSTELADALIHALSTPKEN